jgi:hypothetical protein
MNKKYMSFLESAYGIAAYETVPKRMDKKHFKAYGETFEFKNVGDILDNESFDNIIHLTKDEKDWAGYASYRKDNDCIYNVEVNPKYRGMGICSKILDSYPNVKYLHVKADNESAIKAYEKYGFIKSPIFAYDDYNNKPNYVLMYNSRTVGQDIFRKGPDGHQYLNINLPETGWAFYIKAYKIDTNEMGVKVLTPLDPIVNQIKQANDKPSCLLYQTKGGNYMYMLLHNVSKDTPLTTSLDNVQPTLHESLNMNAQEKFQLVQESLVLFETSDSHLEILANKLLEHQKNITAAKSTNVLALTINKSMSDLETDTLETIKNWFGFYSKFPYKEVVKYFDKLYKEWQEDIKKFIKLNETTILLNIQKQYTLSDATIKKVKPIIFEATINYYLLDVISKTSYYFIKHCDEGQKMLEYLTDIYKKHETKWDKAEKEFEKYLDKKFK